VVSGPATVSGGILTVTGTGTVTVQAYQPGDADYGASNIVTESFTVSKAAAQVSLGNLSQVGTGSALAPAVSTIPSPLQVILTYNGTPAPVILPLDSLVHFRSLVGQTVYVSVTGSSSGTVYGTGAYAINSSVSAAAVHAGIISPGQGAVLQVRIGSDTGAYVGSTHNGVTSLSLGAGGGSFQVIGIATSGYTNGPVQPGSYQVTATVVDSAYSGSASATLNVLSPAPAFILQPVSETVAPARSVVFSAAATGVPLPTYQWTLNGSPLIPGAAVTDDATLLVSGLSAANAGSYVCTATNSWGSATAAATLAITPTASPGFLSNLSARASVGTGGGILIGGYVVAGSAAKQLLLRGVGPGLYDTFSLGGTLSSPVLTLLDSSQLTICSDTGWGNAPVPGMSAALVTSIRASASMMTTLGAFSLAAGSADSAMVISSASGAYTAQITGVGGATGVGLAEIYDADSSAPSTRLINISARAPVGVGGNVLIGGFVIGGTTAETVLIRAVGPGLTDVFGLTGTLSQPVLTLYDSHQNLIASNQAWGGDAVIAGASTAVGAFALNSQHADSALLITLPPGAYTAQVSGAGGTTGVALVEIYEVP
jgi:LCCL domain/Immunoglobulin I-set domain/MBG domain